MPRRGRADTAHFARYSLIVRYVKCFKRGGSVLDVGCGVGTLIERLGQRAYSRYVGLDLPGEPIRVASRHADHKTILRCADANTYMPPETYDAVVFSESLYYLRDPLAGVAERTARRSRPRRGRHERVPRASASPLAGARRLVHTRPVSVSVTRTCPGRTPTVGLRARPSGRTVLWDVSRYQLPRGARFGLRARQPRPRVTPCACAPRCP